MATFAVDIDDTLYSFGNLARQVICDEAARTGDDILRQAAYSPWTEWRSPPDQMGLNTWIDIIEKCHTDEMIWMQQPYVGARDTLWNIFNSGHDLIYISNRREDSYGATAAWLENNDFPNSSLEAERVKLICTTGDKHKHLTSCQYMIDDRPKTLVEFVFDFNWKNKWGSVYAEKKRKGFGLLSEYNRSLTDVPGVFLAPNWGLLASHLVRKELIGPTYVVN